MFRHPRFAAFAIVSAWLVSSLLAAEPPADTKQTVEKPKDPYAWKSLFDGKTIAGWKPGEFGGEGEVSIKDGTLVLGCGESLTGIVYQGKPPRMDFEITLEAMRLDGSDFFATTTFPVGKEYCSLVVGGWGGTVVGLSNVDFYDAGDNITTRFVDLKSKKWYRVRIRVSRARIEAWIDKEQVVDLPTEGHKFGTRFEVDPCKPLGIASFCTTAALRDIRIRRLKPEEVAVSFPHAAKPPQAEGQPKREKPAAKAKWQSLFDGKKLGKWEIAKEYDFQAHGPIAVEDGAITIKPGSPAGGIRWGGKMPRIDYEISLQAKRTEGHDFFCAVTFPIKKSHCTLIVGGWGGSIIGLSNIDGVAAAENSSCTVGEFKSNQWYNIRLRVTSAKIEAWIDKEKVIDQPTADHEFTIWWEQEPLRPLGIATWETGSAIKNIRLRVFDAD